MVDVASRTEVLVVFLDGEGRVLQFGQSVDARLGEPRVLQEDAFEQLFADGAARVREAFLSATCDQPVELEAEVKARDGRARAVNWWCFRHDVSVSAPARYFAIGIDRTEERELERRALQNARAAAGGVLAAGLAHEIRNPLNGASLHLSVLERELGRLSGVSPSATDALSVVRAELRRLSALVTDFLEVARPRPLLRTHADMNGVARAIVAELEGDAAARRIRLVADLPTAPVVAYVDAERLKQAVANLVQNALDAVEQDGNVVVRVRSLPTYVIIEVEDDGRGVSSDSPPLFDAFYTTKRSGTGLGLSIVHRIVSDHGGDVTYTSAPKHTVFRLRIPAPAVLP